MIVIAGLSRQYRTMQAELTRKVETLEEEVSKLKEELGMNISIFYICASVNCVEAMQNIRMMNVCLPAQLCVGSNYQERRESVS